jgi:outer membrane protein assembly factor BamB
MAQNDTPILQKPLRLWPGVVIAILQCLVSFGAPLVGPDAMLVGLVAGPVGALLIVLWWVFFSRAPWSERLGAVGLMVTGLFATSRIIDKSLATGAQGMLFPILAIPGLGLALVVWAVATGRLSNGPRRATMVAAILLACGVWGLVRTGGFTASNFHNDLHWRWTMTPEERLLAKSRNEPRAPVAVRPAEKAPGEPLAARTGDGPTATPPAPAAAKTSRARVAAPATAAPTVHEPAPSAANTGADWPGFRGPHRDSIIPGVRIETDWSASPPVEMWRRPIGPGWSSFAVRGDLFYTQEQRGSDEVVACYKVTTGEPVWKHSDAARFWESNAGAGPRATPTLSNGRAYTFGATGIVNALDASSGAVLWSRNAASDTGVKIPGWGFASSPLVVDGVVVVATAGKLVAYEIATGKPRWFGPAGGGGYSSPHLVTIDGVAQILLLSGHGAASVAPGDGALLWEYPWPSDVRIVQPGLASDGDFLMGNGEGMGGSGIRRVAVAHGSTGWTTEERWTSGGLKPNFNDFVVHKGHVYGFDGSILACIDLKDGKRVWKGGRYGNGQLILLPDQDVLLVLSEEGELALVKATPDQFTELARFPAIQGKTWNHPVLAGDVLLVRNGEEMAAFRLSLARR